jgi:uncharacterized protein YndB with AHSA1/START domain
MSFVRTDRIEKQVQLAAEPARVWRALTQAGEFGSWFGVKLEGPFVAGTRSHGTLDLPDHERVPLELDVERMEPETVFSFRWHPYAVDPTLSYTLEPTTLVEFHLEPSGTGTLVKVVESGFERVPYGRREEAYRRNLEGWGQQMINLQRHVER